jgi:hypothetical protein
LFKVLAQRIAHLSCHRRRTGGSSETAPTLSGELDFFFSLYCV